MEDYYPCSIKGCDQLAICTDGKDGWCIDHEPSKRDKKKYDIRPLRRLDIPDYPY